VTLKVPFNALRDDLKVFKIVWENVKLWLSRKLQRKS